MSSRDFEHVPMQLIEISQTTGGVHDMSAILSTGDNKPELNSVAFYTETHEPLDVAGIVGADGFLTVSAVEVADLPIGTFGVIEFTATVGIQTTIYSGDWKVVV